MGKKKKILAGICIIVLIALNVLIVGHEEAVNGNYELHLTVKSDTEQNVQVYYSTAGEVSEEMSQVKPYDQIGNNQEFVFSVPFQCNMVRLDLGNKPGYFEIQDVYLSFKDTKESIAEIDHLHDIGTAGKQLARDLLQLCAGDQRLLKQCTAAAGQQKQHRILCR